MKLTITENFILPKNKTLSLINDLFEYQIDYTLEDLGLVDDLINKNQNPMIFFEEHYKVLLNYLVWTLITNLDSLDLYPQIKKEDDNDYEYLIIYGDKEVQVSTWVESTIEDLNGISPLYTVFDTLKYGGYFN